MEVGEQIIGLAAETTIGGRWKLYENRVLLCSGRFEPGI